MKGFFYATKPVLEFMWHTPPLALVPMLIIWSPTLPHILQGINLSIGYGWRAIIGAEIIAAFTKWKEENTEEILEITPQETAINIH